MADMEGRQDVTQEAAGREASGGGADGVPIVASVVVGPEDAPGGDSAGSAARSARYAHLKPFKPGQSGNPAGGRKKDPEVVAIFKAAGPEAARALVELATQKGNPKLRLQASEAILDRLYGKAVQPIDATVGGSGDPITIIFEGALERWSR